MEIAFAIESRSYSCKAKGISMLQVKYNPKYLMKSDHSLPRCLLICF